MVLGAGIYEEWIQKRWGYIPPAPLHTNHFSVSLLLHFKLIFMVDDNNISWLLLEYYRIFLIITVQQSYYILLFVSISKYH